MGQRSSQSQSVPDIHLPRLLEEEDVPQGDVAEAMRAERAGEAITQTGHRPMSLLKIGLEVLLISAGVFLGLMGEQWRERVHQREIAEVSLRRFRTELQANRRSVAAVKDKHVAKLQALRAYFARDPARRPPLGSFDDATDPAFIESSAWDLALATQSLAYIDSDVALAISHVYAAQRQLEDATRAVTQAMYATTDGAAFLSHGLATYWADCTLLEPRLLTIYDEVLPRLDRALGD
jgi:hypothetical protein